MVVPSSWVSARRCSPGYRCNFVDDVRFLLTILAQGLTAGAEFPQPVGGKLGGSRATPPDPVVAQAGKTRFSIRKSPMTKAKKVRRKQNGAA
jgi:hypothetical protein